VLETVYGIAHTHTCIASYVYVLIYANK